MAGPPGRSDLSFRPTSNSSRYPTFPRALLNRAAGPLYCPAINRFHNFDWKLGAKSIFPNQQKENAPKPCLHTVDSHVVANRWVSGDGFVAFEEAGPPLHAGRHRSPIHGFINFDIPLPRRLCLIPQNTLPATGC